MAKNAWEDAPVVQEEAPQVSTSVFQPSVPYSGVAEAARSVAQGATFGFADELEAAARTGRISGPEYERLRNQLRAQQGQFGQRYPLLLPQQHQS